MADSAALNLDQLAVNTIRALSIDGVQRANSGHPGLPLDAAPMAFVLWTRFLRHNPLNPSWIDRDRFVFSPGHGSILLYSLLHLAGYDLSLDDLRQFRQWGSRTPGHPEYGVTPGVELTTGPLGQGFANGVGLAVAEAHLAGTYNRPGHRIVDHYTYGIVSDGDVMEGVAYESASLAGHWKLGKLIYLYDDNQVTLSGAAGLSFTEDVPRRFEAMDWQVLRVADGNDLGALEQAVLEAQADTGRPTLIAVRTTIGFGSPQKQGSFEVHGNPLGADEVVATKRNLGWTYDEPFTVPDEVRNLFGVSAQSGAASEVAWNERFGAYEVAFPDLATRLKRTMARQLPDGWDSALPIFAGADGKMATRAAGARVINALAEALPELMGGSADLDPSTNTALKNHGDFARTEPVGDTQGTVGGGWGYAGRNVHYGIREHAMGAITNGLAYHGGVIPFSATFLTFSDYMRPAIRLAALSDLGSIFVFTHDSVGLGEDGPTHQPVEHLPALRAIPNLVVFRPADANEVTEGWRIAIERRHGATTLVFSRQAVPTFDRSDLAASAGARRGAYVLKDWAGATGPRLIVMASGSEVSLGLEAVELFRATHPQSAIRLVSFPSWELFEQQDQSYRDSVFPPADRLRLAIEAAVPLGWERWVGESGAIVGVNRFGASAPAPVIFEKFGFTPEAIAQRLTSMSTAIRG